MIYCIFFGADTQTLCSTHCTVGEGVNHLLSHLYLPITRAYSPTQTLLHKHTSGKDMVSDTHSELGSVITYVCSRTHI